MFNPSKSSIAEQIADVVEKLPEKRKNILYLAKLQEVAIIASRLDKKGKKIKGKRSTVAEISKIVSGNRNKRRAGYL